LTGYPSTAVLCLAPRPVSIVPRRASLVQMRPPRSPVRRAWGIRHGSTAPRRAAVYPTKPAVGEGGSSASPRTLQQKKKREGRR
jgi:hypothetical protein